MTMKKKTILNTKQYTVIHKIIRFDHKTIRLGIDALILINATISCIEIQTYNIRSTYEKNTGIAYVNKKYVQV